MRKVLELANVLFRKIIRIDRQGLINFNQSSLVFICLDILTIVQAGYLDLLVEIVHPGVLIGFACNELFGVGQIKLDVFDFVEANQNLGIDELNA